jgi:asparagine synthase (glutamine-hydrolysing)
MCGIFGIINYTDKTPVTPEQLRKPLSLMVHRGPNDDGIMTDRYAGLGMRRLSIIDIPGGHQPISNETGEISIIFNGEIYNYRELREELEAEGHKFKTRSDTEVILHLYEEYGEACPGKLNGMFAFAVWDKKKEELFVARDRIGVKPLFFSAAGGKLMFSSEIRALLSAGVSREPDLHAVADYFAFYYISSPRTIYRDIRRLSPGHSISLKNGRIEIRRYWDFTFIPAELDEEQAVPLIQETLFSSVKRHLMSEVPLGVFLSSGMDSASIVAMMRKAGSPVTTYTVGYENGGTYNELDGARLVAEKYGTTHHECTLNPSQAEKYIPEIIGHLAEPHGDWTQAGFYHLSKESKKDMTVVLSGAGGDELFAGYPTLTAAKFAKYYNLLPKAARDLIKAGVMKLPSSYERLSLDFKAKSFVAGAELIPERAHMRYKEIFDDEERKNILYNNTSIFDPFEVYKQHLPGVPDEEPLNRLLYLDLKVFLPDCALQVTDITTMMNSQECRVPFLDLEMIELSRRIPLSMKLRGVTTKHILRKALKGYLPKEITRMPKKGFAMPTAFWLKNELRGFVESTVSRAAEKKNDLVNLEYARRIIAEHNSGKRDNTRKITCLVSFLLWQEMYQ